MEKKIVIFADTREFSSEVVIFLARHDCTVKQKMLHVADYLVSDRVAIERKTAADFVSSVIDQRLFSQVKRLKENFEKPVLIVEGDNIYERLNPNAVRGTIASLVLDFNIPIIWTRDPGETAGMIFWLAKREQIDEKREVAIRGEKKAMSVPKQQEFIVAGLPGVSNKRARALLKHFKTPSAVFSAEEKELVKVEGIGKKTAKNIRKLLETKYKRERK
ncbi:MAG: ERCC4 domain-containing protein [Candidatus Aenigmatarchaeota archaeon]